MRANKFIAERLGISRRAADKLIQDQQVLANNNIIKLGDTIDETATVLISGKTIPKPPSKQYIILNKPVGYVCSRRGQGAKTIYDILPKEFYGLNPVGRLDKNSSGLLLLTNDGDLHNRLTHPSNNKIKEYIIKLDKILTNNDRNKIQGSGVKLRDGVSKLEIRDSGNDHLLIRMHEGRNRQIRRTFATLGYEVTHLHRTKFGPYEIAKLSVGEYRISSKLN